LIFVPLLVASYTLRMLIVFGGLPGSGKTTLSRELARRLSATWLRVDTLEQAILRSGIAIESGSAGYFTAYAVAEDNLRLGATVIADAVNALTNIRNSWRELAGASGVLFVEVEVTCSNPTMHRQRIEQRSADIYSHVLPSWQEVQQREYHPWEGEPIRIDTALLSVEQATDEILRRLSPHLVS